MPKSDTSTTANITKQISASASKKIPAIAKPKKASKTTSKKTETKYPPGFRGCKTCCGTDHRRCTKHKCPKHPNYDPPLRRGSSFEWPFSYSLDEDYGKGAATGWVVLAIDALSVVGAPRVLGPGEALIMTTTSAVDAATLTNPG